MTDKWEYNHTETFSVKWRFFRKMTEQELNEPKEKGFHWLRNIDETFIVESYGNGFYSLTGNPKTYRWKELVERIKVTQYLGRAFPPNEGR